jgi:hypothetical protein
MTSPSPIDTTTDADQALGIFRDMYAQGADVFVEFCLHCGIALEDLNNAGRSYEPVILAHYAVAPGAWSIDRIAADMTRWPPFAKRIAEIEAENKRKAARQTRKNHASP